MYPKAIIAVLLVSLLIFGCTGPSAGTPAGGGTQPPGTPPGQGGNPVQPENQTPPANGSGQPSGGEPNGGQPSGGDLVGKTFEELAALGVPIQCQITTSSGTVTLFKGIGSDMRTEMAAGTGLCPGQKVIFIVKGDKYYMGCDQGMIMPGSTCQWLVFNATGDTGATPGAEKPDYSDVPPAQISCMPWVPNPAMLQAPENACSLQDLVKVPPIPSG